jgi:hypothetical protein
MMSDVMPYADSPIEIQINMGFLERDTARVRALISSHPDHIRCKLNGTTWLHEAARIQDIDLMRFLLERGHDVNAVANESVGHALMPAIHKGSVEGVKLLLAHGADPNINRTLIGAINRSDPALGLEIIKLLIEHGADINRVFPWGEDQKLRFTPLSWAIASGKQEIADYLRSKGAKTPPVEIYPGPASIADQIVAYFEKKLGPVQPQALQEIVPSGLPIAIHVVPPSEGRDHITLFTTGMSQQPMNVPPGSEQLQYAELAINLPADWPLPGQNKPRSLFGWLKKSNSSDEAAIRRALWPILWLRAIARYPHEHRTWLGGAALIFANGEPPQPLAPGVPFTSLLMLNAGDIACAGGQTIQIYQLVPLYTEERDLEITQGIPVLLQAMDRHSISWVVDLSRSNVAKP